MEDVGSTHPFDLRCTHQRQELHVEVKGTTSNGEQVILTRNEVRHARAQHPDVELFVVRGIMLTPGEDGLIATGGIPMAHERWRVDDGQLEPIAYQYRVPAIG